VAQAISYYRAVESKIWRAWNDDRTPGEAAPRQPMYDRARIERYLTIVRNQDEGWRRFFLERNVPALVLIYEEFVASYDQTVRAVLKFLGISSEGVMLPRPALRRLADAESEAWERRFREGAPVAVSVPNPEIIPPQVPTPPVGDETSTRSGTKSPAETLALIAYDVGSPVKPSLASGRPGRVWMDRTPKRFAYRCLPMVIANQWGWMITAGQRVEAIWNGTRPLNGLIVACGGPGAPSASSHFGCGILTFHIGYLFRTPPGFNLHVRGPANMPKDGIHPLEAIVESDWTAATFTMNWQMTRPNHRVVFEAGEPIAMISPVRRGELERFVPEVVPLRDNADLLREYTEWSASRDSFNAGLRVQDSAERKSGWQKDYTRGRTIGGEVAPEHQTGLELKEFSVRKPSGPG
jgi:Family of unknown function (DUF6065)/Stf0 sulphotransferase